MKDRLKKCKPHSQQTAHARRGGRLIASLKPGGARLGGGRPRSSWRQDLGAHTVARTRDGNPDLLLLRLCSQPALASDGPNLASRLRPGFKTS
jgi:hypothetical protein